MGISDGRGEFCNAEVEERPVQSEHSMRVSSKMLALNAGSASEKQVPAINQIRGSKRDLPLVVLRNFICHFVAGQIISNCMIHM